MCNISNFVFIKMFTFKSEKQYLYFISVFFSYLRVAFEVICESVNVLPHSSLFPFTQRHFF
uniref:Uncharacterized protein n=1 Tax=Anguilla anguilla TaxID=7936 RepID=A0A0E9WQ29_ANGAN